MAETTIEWTDKTWNPLRGCTRISEGCRNCYAERMAARFSGEGRPYEGLAKMTPNGPRWTGEIRLLPEVLPEPLSWRKSSMVFVNSMSDLFHEKVPFSFVDKVFAIMAMTPKHTYQVLTKRPERMTEYFTGEDRNPEADVWEARDSMIERGIYPARNTLKLERESDHPDPHNPSYEQFCWNPGPTWPLPNVWLGTSVESADHKRRIDALRDTPASVRFISFEPLLGDIGPVNLTGIQWAIVGAESGPGARPMQEDWVRNLRGQSLAQGVKFFYKQRLDDKGHKVSLPELDGRQWMEMPTAVNR